jgi:hypothetical protein
MGAVVALSGEEDKQAIELLTVGRESCDGRDM